jgi:hypothetical protein
MYLIAVKYLRWKGKPIGFKYISAQRYYYIENSRKDGAIVAFGCISLNNILCGVLNRL